MAVNKKSVIIYIDIKYTIDMLTDEDAGKYFKHLLSYVNDDNPKPLPGLLAAVFEPFKHQMKRDLKKWEKTREGRSKAGLASAKKRAELKAANPTSVKSVEQKPTNPTVNATVNVNVTDTVIDNDTKEDTNTLHSIEIERVFDLSLELFPSRFLPSTEKQCNDWKDEIRKLHTIDKHGFDVIIAVIEWATSHKFWKTNVCSMMRLRKKNSDGMKCIDVLLHQIESQKPQFKLLTRDDVINKTEFEGRWFQVFKKVEHTGQGILYAHKDDIETHKLKVIE